MPPRYAIGHVTSDPIHFMFGSRVGGFQGWRIDRLHQIQVGGRPPTWIISNGHISAAAHSIHLYSAHRAVIFAIAQLFCFIGGLLCCVLCGMWNFKFNFKCSPLKFWRDPRPGLRCVLARTMSKSIARVKISVANCWPLKFLHAHTP